MTQGNQPKGILALAREVLLIESDAVRSLTSRLGDDFVRAVNALLECKGRVVVTAVQPVWC